MEPYKNNWFLFINDSISSCIVFVIVSNYQPWQLFSFTKINTCTVHDHFWDPIRMLWFIKRHISHGELVVRELKLPKNEVSLVKSTVKKDGQTIRTLLISVKKSQSTVKTIEITSKEGWCIVVGYKYIARRWESIRRISAKTRLVLKL